MVAIAPILGCVGVLIAYQLKKQNKQIPLVWRGIYCFILGIAVILLFWTPGQGVQNIGLLPAGLFFLIGLFYEVKAYLNKQNAR